MLTTPAAGFTRARTAWLLFFYARDFQEDVAKWHGVYMTELEALFDRHKGRFGYGGRELVLV